YMMRKGKDGYYSDLYSSDYDYQPFPTRRSSDLPPDKSRGRRPGGGASEASSPLTAPWGEVSVRRGVRRSSPCPDRHPHTSSPGRDRKSTRLNSSHVKISYAVFCLKKKICILDCS